MLAGVTALAPHSPRDLDVAGSDASLRRFLHGLPGVDQVGAEARAAGLGTRSIKTTAKATALDLAISMVDLTTLEGADTAGKVKALAAKANGVPFYVALPSPTIDWTVRDGLREIPIEERGGTEVTHVQGRDADGRTVTIQVAPDGTTARNPAFDVTPAALVTGLITERGVVAPSELSSMFPERAKI